MRTLLCFFICLLLSACSTIEISDSLENEQIEVTVIYPDQRQEKFELKLYSTLADLLNLIKCETCDLSRLNPQAALHPKDVIVLYEKSNNCISINQGNLEELDTLPGIGPSLSQRIIDYRNTNGYFQSLEDIMLIKGIKDKLFAKIQAYICL